MKGEGVSKIPKKYDDVVYGIPLVAKEPQHIFLVRPKFSLFGSLKQPR